MKCLLLKTAINGGITYRTRSEARADVFDYIERFHNPRRRRQLKTKKVDLMKLSVETG